MLRVPIDLLALYQSDDPGALMFARAVADEAARMREEINRRSGR